MTKQEKEKVENIPEVVVEEQPMEYCAVEDCIFKGEFVAMGQTVVALPSEMSQRTKFVLKSEYSGSEDIVFDRTEKAEQILADKKNRALKQQLSTVLY